MLHLLIRNIYAVILHLSLPHGSSLTYDTCTVMREEVGLSLDKAGKEVLGHASKVVLTKDTSTIIGDGSTQEAVNKRVAQIRNLIEVTASLSLSMNIHILMQLA